MKVTAIKPRRGIYFLPSAFTVANLFCGFYSIINGTRREFELAAVLIGYAILLDTLDGRIARFANATSEFGREFDSLADVVSFGVAPGVLVYIWALHLWPRLGWLTCFLFVICGAMRLARFNIQRNVPDKRFFVGMPIPAAAAVLASIVFMFPSPLGSKAIALPILVLVVILALLMVSKLRYYSFKDIDLRRRQTYLAILLLAMVFVVVYSHPQVMLLALSFAYMTSGPVLKLHGIIRRSHLSGPPQAAYPAREEELAPSAPKDHES